MKVRVEAIISNTALPRSVQRRDDGFVLAVSEAVDELIHKVIDHDFTFTTPEKVGLILSKG